MGERDPSGPAEDSRNNARESVVDALYAHVRSGHPGASPAVPAAPVPAVACLLWRPRTGGGVEVYAAQRAASLAFLGGYWAFPGGRIEASDESPISAAIRETREETGIELAADPSRFAPAGRWITPAFSPLRFDTQYFLVRAPADAEPDYRVSDGEHEDGCWIAPGDAISKWRAAEWLIPSTVLRALRALEPGIEGAASRCQREAELARDEPRVWEISPGVAISPLRSATLPPATHTNCFFIGVEEIVAIDPGSPFEEEQRAVDRAIATLEARGGQVVEIWLTHHHFDHAADARRLAERLGVPVAAHPATAELLGDRVTVQRHLLDGETRELAGEPRRRLRVIDTPGHAPGHLCFLEEETQVLLAGDLIATWGTILIDPSEGDMAAYLDSLRRVRALAPRVLLPAHGGAIVAVQTKLEAYIAHRLWREDRVCEALRALPGASPVQLVEMAYSDVAPALYPLAERSLIAHLAKLEADGRARRRGRGWEAFG